MAMRQHLIGRIQGMSTGLAISEAMNDKLEGKACGADLVVRLHCCNHHLHVSPATAPPRITPCGVEVATAACIG